MLPVLLTIVTVFYFIKKQWLKLLMVWGFAVGYIMLYNISDTKATHRFYSEVSYLPVIIFVGIPALFDVLPIVFEKIKWMPVVLVSIISVRLVTISFNHQAFENNFNWIENKINYSEENQSNRFLIKEEYVPTDLSLIHISEPTRPY